MYLIFLVQESIVLEARDTIIAINRLIIVLIDFSNLRRKINKIFRVYYIKI